MKQLITFLMLVVVNISALAQFSGPGSGTLASPYLITSATQLNEVRNDLSAHYKLVSNIDVGEWIKSNLGNNGWIPIGTEGLPFKGTFDGAGFKIINLASTRQNNVGLFGVTSRAKVCNLSLTNVSISGQNNIGTLIGCSENTEISNIQVDGRSSGTSNVGGLIGTIQNSSTTVGGNIGEISNTILVENCIVNADVLGSNNIGGIIGNIFVSTKCEMDTKIARKETASYNGYWYMHCKLMQCFENCTYVGELSGNTFVGGIIGFIDLYSNTHNKCTYTPTQVSYTYHYYSEAVSHVHLNDCIVLATGINGNSKIGGVVGGTNADKIQTVGTIYNHGYDAGPGPSNILSINNCTSNIDLVNCDDYIGGIIGYGHPKITGEISNCSAGSNIQGKNYIGGIIGWGPYDIKECSAIGNVSGTSFVGGIIGDSGKEIVHCYYSGNITNSGNYTGGICGNTCSLIKQCVVGSEKISGVKYIGRISGGYNETLNNFANVLCDVKSNGYSLDVPDDEYNGYGIAYNNLKSRSFYQGLSWDMDNLWDIMPGITLPFHRTQTFPPLISNVINSESIYVNGTCSDNGGLYVKSNNSIKTYNITNNNWEFYNSPTSHICLYSLALDKHPSIPACLDIKIIATNLSLSTNQLEIGIGQTETLLPNFKPLNSETDVVWNSSNTNIATVNSNGVVTGLNDGSCVITCMDKISGLSAECVVNVIIRAESVTVNPTEADIELFSTIDLYATVYPENTTNKSIKWISTNPDIAVVDENGRTTAQGYGSTYIVAQTIDGLHSDMCKINVVKHVENITLSDNEVSLNLNETYLLTATVSPEDATNKLIEWTSSNPSIATIDEGLIKAVSEGTSIITARTIDNNLSDVCIVIVTNDNAGVLDAYLDKEITYSIYTLGGVLIKREVTNSGLLSATIKNLQSGEYIISIIRDNGKISSFKIIK